MPWAIYLWPGLPQIWLRRPWNGLAKAVGAAVVLNAVLLSSFGWSELVSPGMRKVLGGAVVLFWTSSAVAGYSQTRWRSKRKPAEPAKDTFLEAQDLYLRGDFFQAECLLVEMLGRNERDLDARLMLATLYRHNRRYEEATKQLDVLVRYEGSEKWEWEIERERVMISEAKNEINQNDDTIIETPSRLSHAA
jgi:hypothetical protein